MNLQNRDTLESITSMKQKTWDKSSSKLQSVKVNNYRSKYSLYHGDVSPTVQKAIKGSKITNAKTVQTGKPTVLSKNLTLYTL